MIYKLIKVSLAAILMLIMVLTGQSQLFAGPTVCIPDMTDQYKFVVVCRDPFTFEIAPDEVPDY